MASSTEDDDFLPEKKTKNKQTIIPKSKAVGQRSKTPESKKTVVPESNAVGQRSKTPESKKTVVPKSNAVYKRSSILQNVQSNFQFPNADVM
jgi:hypothetical protein